MSAICGLSWIFVKWRAIQKCELDYCFFTLTRHRGEVLPMILCLGYERHRVQRLTSTWPLRAFVHEDFKSSLCASWACDWLCNLCNRHCCCPLFFLLLVIVCLTGPCFSVKLYDSWTICLCIWLPGHWRNCRKRQLYIETYSESTHTDILIPANN